MLVIEVERRAEFVAHVGEKTTLQIVGGAQLLGLVVELGIQRHHAPVGLVELHAQRGDVGLARRQFRVEIRRVHATTTTQASS